MNHSISRMIGIMTVLVTAWFATEAGAAVKLANVFSDHMVLQRDLAVPIWGTAAPGETVTVKFRTQAQTTTAGADGKWLVKLEPLAAGGPDKLVVNTVTNEDVLVGEVWVGSGQSNMQMTLGSINKGDEVLVAQVAAAPYPQIRQVQANGTWRVADAKNINSFSALLFAFGLRLHKELGVPVGLMLGAVGGTPSGYWLSEEALKNDAACQALIKKYAATFNYDEAMHRYKVELEKWEAADAQAQKDNAKRPRRPTPPAKAGETSGSKVGNLYEVHIRPFLSYGMRGVLWDQGEAGTALPGVDQFTLMGALIGGWRKEWNEGNFPFIYVEKPSGGGCAWDNTNPVTNKGEEFSALPPQVPNDGQSVETHIKIMTYPNTAMAISSDLGPGVHPTNKSGYGHRAADVALGLVYGQKIEYYGPLYTAHKIEGDKVRISFTHAGQGLAFKHGDKLQGFALAGDDKKFQWADAVIDGDTVVVSCAAVPKPIFVRYAWSNNRRWANLFNKDGLPAIPFRTDQ